MRTFLYTCALAALTAGAADGQDARLALRGTVGTFAPTSPLVTVQNGTDPSVVMSAGSAAGLEVSYRAWRWVSAYAGSNAAFGQINSSGVIESDAPRPAMYSTTVVTNTLGVVLDPALLPYAVRPYARLGFGLKSYRFDIPEVTGWVNEPTGDLGLGIQAGTGAATFTVEARYLPSQFTASSLPIRTAGEEKQGQNDFALQLGVVLRP